MLPATVKTHFLGCGIHPKVVRILCHNPRRKSRYKKENQDDFWFIASRVFSERGIICPKLMAPKYDFRKMREEYPQAFAYIRAMKMEEKHNLEAVAREAMEQIVNGNWERAVEDMNKAEETEKKREAEWLNKHMWD